MAKKYHVLVEKDEDGWYVSEVIGLPGCHTQAKSKEELVKRTKEAIKAYLHTPNREMMDLSSEFVGVQEIGV